MIINNCKNCLNKDNCNKCGFYISENSFVPYFKGDKIKKSYVLSLQKPQNPRHCFDYRV